MECGMTRRFKIPCLILLQYYFIVVFLTLLHFSLSDLPDFQNWNVNDIRVRASFILCIIHGFCAVSLGIYLVLRKRQEVSECFRDHISSLYSHMTVLMRADNRDNDLSERVSTGFTYVDARNISPASVSSNDAQESNPIESSATLDQRRTKHKRNQSTRFFLSGELGTTGQRSFTSDHVIFKLPQNADGANCEENVNPDVVEEKENVNPDESEGKENILVPKLENVETTASSSLSAASVSKIIKESLEKQETFLDPETYVCPSENKYNFRSWVLLDDLSTETNGYSKDNAATSGEFYHINTDSTSVNTENN